MTTEDVLVEIKKQLDWRGPNNKTQGHIVLTRDMAQHAHEMMQAMRALPNSSDGRLGLMMRDEHKEIEQLRAIKLAAVAACDHYMLGYRRENDFDLDTMVALMDNLAVLVLTDKFIALHPSAET